jgi:cell division septum initiation protein DivIVA
MVFSQREIDAIIYALKEYPDVLEENKRLRERVIDLETQLKEARKS